MIGEAELDRIVARMRRAGLTELDFRDGEDRLLLRLDPVAVAPGGETVTIRAPAMGRFRPAHPRRPGEAASPGTAVAQGGIVGWLEAGTTLVAIPAPQAGTVGDIAVKPGDLVGFHAPIMTLIRKG